MEKFLSFFYNTVEFAMGQFNFGSSIKHTATQMMLEDVLNEFFTENYSFKHSEHSDDAFQILVGTETQRDQMHFIDSVIKKSLNIKENTKKSCWSQIILEMITTFFVGGGTYIPLIKHIIAMFSNPPAMGYTADYYAILSRIPEIYRKGSYATTAFFLQRLANEWISDFYSITSDLRTRKHTLKDNTGKEINRFHLPIEFFGLADVPLFLFSGDNNAMNYSCLLTKDVNTNALYKCLYFFSHLGPIDREEAVLSEDLNPDLLKTIRWRLSTGKKGKNVKLSMENTMGKENYNYYMNKSTNNPYLKFINNKDSISAQMVRLVTKINNGTYIRALSNTNSIILNLNISAMASGQSVYLILKNDLETRNLLAKTCEEKNELLYGIYKDSISVNNLIAGTHYNVIKEFNRKSLTDNTKKKIIFRSNISGLFQLIQNLNVKTEMDISEITKNLMFKYDSFKAIIEKEKKKRLRCFIFSC